MPHLDEGTIHAWLDGALDNVEASRVEAHVAECAECAAAVAEARGLIAGASRVLSALDHVPVHVIPPALQGGGAGPNESGASPGTPGVVSLGARRSAWRRLHMTPARVAAAAVILVAAGTMFVASERREAPIARAIFKVESGPGPRVLDQAASAPPASTDSSSRRDAKAPVAQADSVVFEQKSRVRELAEQRPADTIAVDLTKKVATANASPSMMPSVVPSRAAVGGVAGAPRVAAAQPVPSRLMDSTRTMDEVTTLKSSADVQRRRADSTSAARETRQMPAASAARAPESYAPARADSVAGKRFAAGEARKSAVAGAPLQALSTLGESSGCYELVGAASDTLAPRRFMLDTASYALRNGTFARVVTIPGESATLPRGYWRAAGNAVQVVWNDNTWPRLTIVATPGEGVMQNAPVSAVVDKNGLVAIALRRCTNTR